MRITQLLHVVGQVFNVKTLSSGGRRRRPSHRSEWLEHLEVRTLLSVTVATNGKSATYTDVDGDLVTVAVSTGVLAPSNFTTLATGLGDQLQEINFNLGGFDGANVNITVKKVGAGDGLANVGNITSLTHDLGSVTVPGDLGRINAGDATLTTPGITTLKVRSMGRFGTDTQGAGGTLVSNINALTSLSVTTDIVNAFLNISGTLKSGLTIGGSLIGGEADDSGSIKVDSDIGNIKITRHMLGGAGARSGSISSTNGKLGTVTVGGTVLGGGGDDSGNVSSEGDIGAIKITGDLAGGDGLDTGEIDAGGNVASVTIGGSLVGGNGVDSGRLDFSGTMGAVKITGDIVGGNGHDTGIIAGSGDIASVTVGGSVRGGAGNDSGELANSGNLGAVKITGSLIGGSGNDTGEIDPNGNLASLSIGGSLIGGSGNDSGEVDPNGNCGNITIGGSLIGGSGSDSGEIDPDGNCGNITITGSVVGGSGIDSAEIDPNGNCGTIKVGRDVRGGSGSFSAIFHPNGNLAGVTIGGSLLGGSGVSSGVIAPQGTLGAVSIGRDLIGGSINGTDSLDASGAIIAASTIKSVTIGGSLIAGTDDSTGALTRCGAILTDKDILSITVKGSIIGNLGNNVIIAAAGQVAPTATVDVAIGSLTVSGHVEFARILGGYDASVAATNGRAKINTVKITGDLAASSIVAGAGAGVDTLFGTADDLQLAGGSPVASINSLTIGGQVFGSPTTVSSTDHFGIVSRNVKSVKIGNVTQPVTAADDTDVIEISPSTGDFTIREV